MKKLFLFLFFFILTSFTLFGQKIKVEKSEFTGKSFNVTTWERMNLANKCTDYVRFVKLNDGAMFLNLKLRFGILNKVYTVDEGDELLRNCHVITCSILK